MTNARSVSGRWLAHALCVVLGGTGSKGLRPFILVACCALMAGATHAQLIDRGGVTVPFGRYSHSALEHDDLACVICSQGKIERARMRGLSATPPAPTNSSIVPPFLAPLDLPRNSPNGSALGSPKGLPPAPGVPVGDPVDLLGSTDVLDYNLSLEITPSPQTLSGNNIITFRVLTSGTTFIDLELHQNFSASVQLVPSNVPLTFTRPNASVPKIMRVNLDRAYLAGEQVQIRVTYSGTPVSGGLGSIFFTTTGGNPLIYTLSETRFAHTWWPVKENTNDKATGTLSFVVPENLAVASNGTLISESVTSGKRTMTWRTNYPTPPYLFCFSASAYVRLSTTWNWTDPTTSVSYSMPNLAWVFPAFTDPAVTIGWLEYNNLRLSVFSELFGVYPFVNEKYGTYQFGFGGGMEHQTFSGQGGASNNAFGGNLSAHELMHQWWGDMISPKTWNDIWLNEGFASYGEVLWGEYRPATLASNGPAERIARINARRPSSVADTVFVPQAQINNESRIFSSTFSYNKGAWVVHMLRYTVGDTHFYNAMREYRRRHAFSTASTADLQDAFEDTTGQDLSWFFNQWVFQIGAPSYQWSWRAVSAGGRNFIEVYLNQTQTTAWPRFTTVLPVRATVSGTAVDVRMRNDQPTQFFLLPMSAVPTAAALDPDTWLLTVSSSTDTSVANSKQLITWPSAPPRVVAGSVAPGGTFTSGVNVPTQLSLTVHEALNPATVSSTSVQLMRGIVPNTQAVASTVTYNVTSRTITVSPIAPLTVGDYSLILSDSVRSALNISLDGEANADYPNTPSGNGVAGGNFVLTFAISPCSPADIGTQGGIVGSDNRLDNNDFAAFITLFFAQDLRADVGGQGGITSADGQLDNNDFAAFITLFFNSANCQ